MYWFFAEKYAQNYFAIFYKSAYQGLGFSKEDGEP